MTYHTPAATRTRPVQNRKRRNGTYVRNSRWSAFAKNARTTVDIHPRAFAADLEVVLIGVLAAIALSYMYLMREPVFLIPAGGFWFVAMAVGFFKGSRERLISIVVDPDVGFEVWADGRCEVRQPLERVAGIKADGIETPGAIVVQYTNGTTQEVVGAYQIDARQLDSIVCRAIGYAKAFLP